MLWNAVRKLCRLALAKPLVWRTFTGKLRPYSLIRGLFGEGHLSSGGGGALVFSQTTQRVAVAPGIDPLLMTVYIVVLDCRQLLVNQHDYHGDV